MAEFNLARESIEEVINYNVLETNYENGADQRRLKHANALIGFKITSPPLTSTQMKQYRDFFIARYGAYDSFDFTSPFDSTKYEVKFVQGSFRTTYNKGAFQCSFEFERVI